MPTNPLEVTTVEHDDTTCIYKLSGNLYGNTSGYAFQEEVRRRVEATKRIIIDFGGVRRIDSCGIGILASITVSARNADAGIVLAALPESVEKALGLTWFLKSVDHAVTVEDAVAKLDAMA